MRQNQFTAANQAFSPDNTVVLVGAALNGPSNTPFILNDDQEPHKVLGQSPLAEAYLAARAAGSYNIVAYRINGVHATAKLLDATGRAVVEFRSVSASDIYNQIQMKVYPTHLHIIQTDDTTRDYFFDRYPTVRELVYAINRDSFYGLVEFTAISLDEYFTLANIVSTEVEIVFSGGQTEEHLINARDLLNTSNTEAEVAIPLLKDKLKLALFGEDPDDVTDRQPNSELGAMHFGVITLCDIYHDDDVEFTEMLASFCYNKTNETGYGCLGVIGTKPIFPEILDLGEEKSFEDTVHEKVLELVSLSESIQDLEAYKYVQVVVGHTEYPELERPSVPVAYGYAAAQAQLPVHVSMSNKAIRGFGKLNFEISKEDIALLTGNGYTCIVPSIRRGFVAFYATSYSKDKESLVSKPHNLRTSQYVSRMLVEEVDYLIGNAYNVLSIKDTLGKAVGLLDGLVADKVIRSYSLNHELLERNTVLNIYASLTPFSEVKSVSSIATISFPQGVIA